MNNFKPDICIYHHPCNDGFAAAWVVYKKWGEGVDFRPTNYGLEVPDEGIEGKNILIADFSFQPGILKDMAIRANHIVVLDHHKTAEADLADVSIDNVEIQFDMEKSGARLVWEFCHPETGPPELIKRIEDRDLWRFKYDDTKLLHLMLGSYEYDFKAWGEIMERYETDRSAFMQEAVAIKRFNDKKIEEIVKTSVTKTIAGHENVAVASAPYAFVSEVAHALLEAYPEAPFAAITIDAYGERTYSLRSTDDREDVSAIAKSFGGGGHRNAAGFRVPG